LTRARRTKTPRGQRPAATKAKAAPRKEAKKAPNHAERNQAKRAR
jgi:hypothetical protein